MMTVQLWLQLCLPVCGWMLFTIGNIQWRPRSHFSVRNILSEDLHFATLYIGWNDVTESMVTIRSPFCGYNTIECVELNGEDLSCYSNETKSLSLRKCSYDHWLTNKAYLSAVTVTNISQTFTYNSLRYEMLF